MKQEMLKELTMLDFMVIDLALYLDTHPQDVRALRKYNQLAIKAKELREMYEEQFGAIRFGCASQENRYSWIDNPWPWDSDWEGGKHVGV